MEIDRKALEMEMLGKQHMVKWKDELDHLFIEWKIVPLMNVLVLYYYQCDEIDVVAVLKKICEFASAVEDSSIYGKTMFTEIGDVLFDMQYYN